MPKNLFWKFIKRYDWLLIVFLFVLLFSFGIMGWKKIDGDLTSLDLIYRTVQLIMLDSGTEKGNLPLFFQLARFGLPVMTAYAAIVVFLRTFQEHMQWLTLFWVNNHIIIGNLGRRGLFLTRGLREMGKKVIVIEDDAQNDRIPIARELGAIVLTGKPSDPMMLRQARVERAVALIGVDEKDNDNLEMGFQARKIFENSPRLLGQLQDFKCLIHLGDYKFCELMQERFLAQQQLTGFRMKSFNVFQEGAYLMWQKYPLFSQESKFEQPPHVLLIGLGRFGQNLLLEMARDWNNLQDMKKNRLKVTIIGKDAGWHFQELINLYPFLNQVIEAGIYQMDVRSEEFYSLRFLSDPQSVDAVYICLDNDQLGLEVGMFLSRALNSKTIPVSIRMLEESNLGDLLRGLEEESKTQINLLGVLNEVCRPDILLND